MKCISAIQIVDEPYADIDQVIALIRARERVRAVRHQCESQVRIPVCQISNFEIVYKLPYLLLIQKQCRDGHERVEFRGNSVGKVELRKNSRTNKPRRQVIHEINGGLSYGNKNQRERKECRRKRAALLENAERDDQGEEFDANQIERLRPCEHQFPDPLSSACPVADCRFERWQAPVKQPVPNVAAADRTGFGGKLNRLFRHLLLAAVAVLRQFRDGVPIQITALIIHLSEIAGRIAAKHRVGYAGGFEEILPVRFADIPEAGNQCRQGRTYSLEFLGDPLNYDHFQRWLDRPQFAHFERADLLKTSDERLEALRREQVECCAEISSCNRTRSWFWRCRTFRGDNPGF